MSNHFPNSLQLKVIAENKLVTEKKVKEISLPSFNGYLGILPGHRPLVVSLGKGPISYKYEKKEGSISISGGYAEILPERVLVFAELKEDENRKREQKG
ncbi:MAG: FoF1 ATP synthase subunit delta/epsilon [Candidatus Aminicenantaceae bacterium]